MLYRISMPISNEVIIGIFAGNDTAKRTRWGSGFQDYRHKRQQDTDQYTIDRSEEEYTDAGCYENIKFIPADFI